MNDLIQICAGTCHFVALELDARMKLAHARVSVVVGLLLGVLDGSMVPFNLGISALVLTALGFVGARSREIFSGESYVFLALYLFVVGRCLWVAAGARGTLGARGARGASKPIGVVICSVIAHPRPGWVGTRWTLVRVCDMAGWDGFQERDRIPNKSRTTRR